MACDYLQDRLHGYLDDELDAVGAAEFERHLKSCPDCSAAFSAERALRNTLAKAQLYERAPASLRSAVQAETRSATAGHENRTNARRVRPAMNWRPLALAATLLFAISSVLLTRSVLQSRSAAPEFAVAAVDAHLRSLQQGHLVDVQSTDQHTVKPWFDGRVDFAPKVADFSGEGFALVGGRLDVLGGKTVAGLVYGRRKHIVNVFVSPHNTIPMRSGSGELQGYRWLAWQASGFDYLAVTDAAAADLEELRSLFAKE